MFSLTNAPHERTQYTLNGYKVMMVALSQQHMPNMEDL